MTFIRKLLIAAGCALAAGAGFHQTHLLREQSAAITRLAQEVMHWRQQVMRYRAEVAPQVESLAASADSDAGLAPVAVTAPTSGDPAYDEATNIFVTRFARLRERLARDARQQIPELRFLDDRDWFEVLSERTLESDIDCRRALSELRNRATMNFSLILASALRGYLKASNQRLPATMRDLAPHFVTFVDDALLDRYEIRAAGSGGELPPDFPIIGQKASAFVDDEVDRISLVITSSSHGGMPEPMPAFLDHASLFGPVSQTIAVGKAFQKFRLAHRGAEPGDAQQLAPFFADSHESEKFLRWRASLPDLLQPTQGAER